MGSINNNLEDSIVKNNDMEKIDNGRINFSIQYSGKPNPLDALNEFDTEPEYKIDLSGSNNEEGIINKLFSDKFDKFQKKNGRGLIQTYFETLPFALFLFLPVFALILRITFRKKGAYVHHLVFSLYFFTCLFIVLTVYSLITTYLVSIPHWIDLLLMSILFFYMWFSLRNFYFEPIFKSFIKTILVVGVTSLVLVPFTIGFFIVSTALY